MIILYSHIILAVYLLIGFQVGGIVYKHFLDTVNIHSIHHHMYCFILIPLLWPIILFLSVFKDSVFHIPIWKNM